MTLIPDPRGLWIQAFIGCVFFNDNYFFPFFVFMLVHYLIVWQTMGVVAFTPLMQWEFIGRMAYIFFWGALPGIAVSIAVNTRPLVPGHTFFAGAPNLGLFLASSLILTGVRSVMILTGQTRMAAPFDPDPTETETKVIYSIQLGVSILAFLGILKLTYIDRPYKDFWSWFAIRYRDNYYNKYIVDYIVALVFILAPQTLWDFLVLKPYHWPQFAAGGLTIFVELLAWIAIYLWFTYFRQINRTHFAIRKTMADERSTVSFGIFCFTVGGIQIMNGIYYLILAEFNTGTLAAEQVLAIFLGITIAVAFILYFVYKKQRRIIQRHRSSETYEPLTPVANP